MFKNQRSILFRFVFAHTVVRRQLNWIGKKAGGARSLTTWAVTLFSIFVMCLLLIGPLGSFVEEKANAGIGDSISDANAPGATAKAIARFDVVPYQIFSDTFEIGVVAFHINGIQRVEFEYETPAGPRTVTETRMRLNPRTGVCEYWTALNATDFTDGAVQIKATVYPNIGIERVLLLELFANSHNTLGGKEELYVSFNGNDVTGEGSRARPFRSIQKALNAITENVSQYDGCTIVLMDTGSYDMRGPQLSAENNLWITIRPDDGLCRDEVVIAPQIREQIRTRIRRMRYCNLSFDFSKIGQIYKEDNHWQWYDNCKWYQSEGSTVTYPGHNWAVRNVGFNGLYVTNSIADEMLYGFVGCNLVRGSHSSNITGDVFQMCRMVVNCTVDKVNGVALEHHTDLFQWWDSNENVIIYGVKAANVAGAQDIFFGEQEGVSYENFAIVNVAVQNSQDRRGPPFTQFSSTQDHVLFMHVSNPGQLSLFRDGGNIPYIAHNVKFVNCIMERLIMGSWTQGVPDGVSVESCHFLRGQMQGTRASTGEISIQDGPGSSFSYEGPGVAEIVGTGQTIPGFNHPNDGSAEDGTPNRGAFRFDVVVEEEEGNAK